jgi:hypothetical protein
LLKHSHQQQQSEGLQLHAFCAEPSMPAAPLPQRRRKRTKTHFRRFFAEKCMQRLSNEDCVILRQSTEELTNPWGQTDTRIQGAYPFIPIKLRCARSRNLQVSSADQVNCE